MKQYDKVYTPVEVKEAIHNGVWLIATGKVSISDEGAKMELVHQHLKEHTDVVVLTLEELKEVWQAAFYHNADAEHAPGLKSYLTSKGINI